MKDARELAPHGATHDTISVREYASGIRELITALALSDNSEGRATIESSMQRLAFQHPLQHSIYMQETYPEARMELHNDICPADRISPVNY